MHQTCVCSWSLATNAFLVHLQLPERVWWLANVFSTASTPPNSLARAANLRWGKKGEREGKEGKAKWQEKKIPPKYISGYGRGSVSSIATGAPAVPQLCRGMGIVEVHAKTQRPTLMPRSFKTGI